jgi:prepilin-type N-terminal cleavage/methylation domain-containing protein
MKQTHRQSGFTIVELLIVIVVIAILAAIVITAYNGTQTRAQSAKYQTDVVTLVKKAESYGNIQGSYALTTAGTDAATVTTQTATGVSLTSTINSVNEAKFPSTLAIFAVVPYGTIPTFAQAMTAINASNTTDYYFVAYCPTGKGMRTYYPEPSTSTVKWIDTGVCP